ncbi:MAG TPA: hypothetical protein VKU01_34545 [Bryobacteraceae bacterium]|nr:hypothetical protein [Bryobacteraceae bacterium]
MAICCQAQTYTIATVAGGANPFFLPGAGDGGSATSAALGVPCYDVAADAVGNLYIVSAGLIRKVNKTGQIATVAGGGTGLGEGIPATQAALSPTAIASDAAGDLFIADTAFGLYRIREVDTTGTITTIAGGAACCNLGDGGPAMNAYIAVPWGLALDSSGNIYVAQASSNYNLIRKISRGTITTVAGGGLCCALGDGGAATSANLSRPLGVAVDGAGNIYIADSGGNRIRRVSGGIITTIAGNGSSNDVGDGGPASQAGLNSPWHVAVDSSGDVFVTELNSGRVRLINPGATITSISMGSPIDSPAGLAIGGLGIVYVANDNAAIPTVASLSPPIPPPSAVTVFTPSQGASGVGLNTALTWGAASGATSYDVYFGPANPPPFVMNTTRLAYSPGQLNPNTTYYWQINAKNTAGTTASIIWSFTTGSTTTSGAQFVPVTPCRIMDTRDAFGTFGGPSISGGTMRTVPISQSACGIPAGAQAYSLNITVVPHGGLQYLTVWPAGQTQPVVSTLNSFDGRIVANAAIVPAGVNSAINVFVSNTADVIIDINGYFGPAATLGSLSFYPVAPCRVADTRGVTGPLSGPLVSGGTVRTFPIASSPCGLPNNAQAYSMNITVVPRRPLGYLTVWPAGRTQPVVSTLNSPDGSVVANAAIVPAGTNGDVSFFATDDTDVIVDVNGYFAPPGAIGGLALYTLTPCRVVDTRFANGPFGSPSVAGGATRTFPVQASVCGVSLAGLAYSLNVTVVPSAGTLGFLTIWPATQVQPNVSTLNSPAGKVVANAAIVPAGSSGAVSVFVTNSTDLIVDINAYFAP